MDFILGGSPDFEIIVKKFDKKQKEINIYPLGDSHVGAQTFYEPAWRKWIDKVKADQNGYVVICGDVFDNAIIGSKGNSYENKMRIRDAKHWVKDELLPIKDKILVIVQGNHEYRSSRITDDCPLYDVASKLDLEDVYRENMGFLKLSLGEKNSQRQFSYGICVAHGKTKNKTDKFAYSLDGIDAMVSGHTHDPSNNFPAKIVMDMHNECIRLVDYVNLVVPSFQHIGGYSLRDMYMPKANMRIPILKFSGTGKKEVWLSWE